MRWRGSAGATGGRGDHDPVWLEIGEHRDTVAPVGVHLGVSTTGVPPANGASAACGPVATWSTTDRTVRATPPPGQGALTTDSGSPAPPLSARTASASAPASGPAGSVPAAS
ncbi:hypothetical protein GCM10029963_54480 [Micromonospora andamanensis]